MSESAKKPDDVCSRSRKIRRGTRTLTQLETNYTQRRLQTLVWPSACTHTDIYMYTHAHTLYLRRQLCLFRGNSSLGLSTPTQRKHLLLHSSLYFAFLSPGKRQLFPASRAQLSLSLVFPMASLHSSLIGSFPLSFISA